MYDPYSFKKVPADNIAATISGEMCFLQSPQVELEEQQLSFSAVGHGAQGEKKYGFTLNLLRPIDTEVICCHTLPFP